MKSYSNITIFSSFYLIIAIVSYNGALGYGDVNSTNARIPATPAQLEECKILRIKPDKCNDIEILKHIYLEYCNVITPNIRLDPAILSILIGAGIAFAVPIFAVRKLKKGEKKFIVIRK